MRRHFSNDNEGTSRHRGYDQRERGLYRSRNGMILGVFKGLADYFDFSVGWLRAIGIIVFIFSGFWPIVVLYLLAALLMKPEPAIPLESLDEKEFYDSYTYSRKGAVHRLKRRFDRLNRRIQRMEDIVTDREFDWDQRLNS
jgi:phage shock protein C